MPFPGSRPLTVALRTVAIASSCALALTACSVSKDDGTDPDAARTTPSKAPTSPTATVTVTRTPSATPTPSATTPSATVTGPEGALLTTAELPRLNETARWREQSTGEAAPEPFGLCQKVDMVSIGATAVLERTWRTTGNGLAGQQVVDFADAQTAVRARRVLESWRGSCTERVAVAGTKVTPLLPVTVSVGTGWHYLVSIPRDDSGSFHALGMAVNGTRMTLLQMVHPGQDHNYDTGKDPMELAVKAAAAKLGG